jgi:hypothetical protein
MGSSEFEGNTIGTFVCTTEQSIDEITFANPLADRTDRLAKVEYFCGKLIIDPSS